LRRKVIPNSLAIQGKKGKLYLTAKSGFKTHVVFKTYTVIIYVNAVLCILANSFSSDPWHA